MIPGFGLVRKLVVVAIVLGGLFVGANVVAENAAESKLAGAVRQEFGLREDPRVDVSGFPLLLNVLRGDLPRISFEADDVAVDALTVDRVTGVLDSIQVENLFSGADMAVVVGEGAIVADISDDNLTAFVRERGVDARFEMEQGGALVTVRRRVGGRVREIVARGDVRLRSGRFEFVPTDVISVDGEPPSSRVEAEAKRRAAVRLDIPDLPGGFAVERVEARPGILRLAASVDGRRFAVQG